MPHTFLVPATMPGSGAAPPARDAGRVLHVYANGTALVEAVERPAAAEPPGEPAPAAGLHLPVEPPDPSSLADARRSIEDAAGLPVPEDEPDVAAYVEFVAPPDPRWLAELRDRHIRVLAYQPDNSYLVRGRRSDLAALAAAVRTSEGSTAIRSVTELTSALKSAPRMLAEAGETTVVVLAATSEERPRVTAALRAVPGVQPQPGPGNDVLDAERIRVRARVNAQGAAALLALPHVLSVESFAAAVPEDEVAGLVLAGRVEGAGRPTGSYDKWLADQQVDGSGAVIGIVDGGVEVDHPAFAGRIRNLAGGKRDWHATMVAGHAAGAYRAERDRDGFTYGLGTAPGATLLSQDRDRAGREACAETVAQAGSAIAIQNNSWGRSPADPMDYGSEEALYDTLVRNARDGGATAVPLTVCFSAGNSGAAGLTRPKGAKNVIVTGNSENYRPDVGGADSDDIREVYTGWSPSSHGNCGDGRIRPHVVSPGEWTASANFAIAPGEAEYVSPMIVWGGGSSGASPKTAGACALLAQWWRRWHAGVDPSPAMLRALVVNGAEPISTGGPAPNNQQGWGRLSLGRLLDPGVARIALDQGDLLTGPSDTRQWAVRVADSRQPVKITLAWTDPPGAVGSGTATASPIVNRLALRVTDGARTWRGNADRFRGGWTADDARLAGVGGLHAEGADNLQCVFLAPGEAGSLVVSVTALAITTDALTGGFARPQQDYALVMTNVAIDHTVTPTPVVAGVVAAATDTGDGLTPDEAAWWAAGEVTGLDGPAPAPPAQYADPASQVPHTGPAPQALHSATVALAAAGGTFDVVAVDAPGLAGAATALHYRLAGEGATGAAVLGVPGGTAVTSAGVGALRALAGLTDLHLVSDDAELLVRLATAVGPHPRIRHRLADGPDTLSGALRDAALEAGGLQQLVLGPPTDDGAIATVRFGIVPSDGALMVTLPARAHEVTVVRPGLPATVLGAPAGSAAGMRTVQHGERTHLVVDRAGETPGVWTVQASRVQPGSAAFPAAAWVQGGADLTVTAREVGSGRRLLRVDAAPGTLLRQMSIPRSRLTAGPSSAPDPESDRPVVVRVRPSRLGQLRHDAPDPEAAAQGVPVPALGHVVDVPAGTPAVLDVPLDVIGVDPGGTVFARRARAGVVATSGAPLEAADDAPLRINGRIDEVRYRAGTVVGVRVTDGRHARELDVRSARLGAAISAMEHCEPVVLGVHGSELEWVFRPFPAAATPVP